MLCTRVQRNEKVEQRTIRERVSGKRSICLSERKEIVKIHTHMNEKDLIRKRKRTDKVLIELTVEETFRKASIGEIGLTKLWEEYS